MNAKQGGAKKNGSQAVHNMTASYMSKESPAKTPKQKEAGKSGEGYVAAAARKNRWKILMADSFISFMTSLTVHCSKAWLCTHEPWSGG